MAALRAATDDLHQRLHEHSLMVELFTRPSLDAYRAVLRGFLRFYQPLEPALVECCRRFGVAERYRCAARTKRLVADLESLGCGGEHPTSHTNQPNPRTPNSLAELAGCLYVIEGSALGGPAILRRISSDLSVDNSCRFFKTDGVMTAQRWNAFQAFCERACRCAASRRAAMRTARRTFEAIAECLTWAEKRASRTEE